MYCSNCGKELEGDEAFCKNCGTKVQQPSDEQNEAETQDETQEDIQETVELQKPEQEDAQETVVLQPAEQEHESAQDKPDTSGVDVSAYPTTPQPPVGQPLFQYTAPMPAVAEQKQYIAAPTSQSVSAGQVEKKSKVPIIIAIVASAVALIAVIVLVVTFVFGGDDSSGEEPQRSYTAVKEEALSEGSKTQNQSAQQKSAPSTTDAMNSASGYLLPDSNSRNYTESELEALSDYELYLARNEIYARLGREFKNQDLKDYFGKKSWYAPRYSSDSFDSQVSLNAYEKKNVNTIRDLEERRNSSYLS